MNIASSGQSWILGGVRRGTYVDLQGAATNKVLYSDGATVALEIAPGPRQRLRVMRATATALTTRPAHRWRVVEWCRARVEDVILWPLSDIRTRFTVKP